MLVRRTTIKAWTSSNFGQIPPLTAELSALEHLKNRCIYCEHSRTFNFIVCSSFLTQVTRTPIKSWMSLKYGQIAPQTAELSALSMFKNSVPPLFLGCYWSDPFLNLHVTRTCIISWIIVNFGQIGQPKTA